MKVTACFSTSLLVIFLLAACQNPPSTPENTADASDTSALSEAAASHPAVDSIAKEENTSSPESRKPALINVTPDSEATKPIVLEKRTASPASKPIPAVPKGRITNFDGVYSNQENSRNYNGILTIRDLGDFKFSFEIVTSGTGGCKGALKGNSVMQEDGTATWSAAGCESLKFAFDGMGKVKVEEKGCSGKHGNQCAFTGNYIAAGMGG